MSRQEKVGLRMAVRMSLAAIATACALAAGRAEGSFSVWAGLALGAVGAVLVSSALIIGRRRMEQPGTLAWTTLKRVGRRMKQPVDARVSSARRARRRERVEQAEAAARVVAVHDSAFAPETLVSAAEALFRLVQLAWDARDRRRLDTLLEPQLREAWTHAMAGFEEDGPRSHAEVSGDVHVDLVGFSGADPPRMVVLIETALRTFKEDNGGRPEPGKVDRLCQYWTLVRRDRAWHVLGIEERAQGAYHLEEPLGNSAAPEPAGTAVTA